MRRPVRVATWEEVLAYGQPGLRKRGLLPPIAGATGSIVGSPGALNVTGGATANTPAWGTGESQTAGNLGVLFVAGTAASTTVSSPGTITGWTAGPGVGVSTDGAFIYFRALTGGDAAPTVPAQTSTSWKCSLAEFTGVTNSATDQTGTTSTGTTTATATAGGADAAPGELVVAVGSSHFSSANTITDTFSLNNGASALTEQNNNGTSAAHHTSQGYSFDTTSNATADAVTYTPSVTATALVVVFASFTLLPSTPFMPHRMPLGV